MKHLPEIYCFSVILFCLTFSLACVCKCVSVGCLVSGLFLLHSLVFHFCLTQYDKYNKSLVYHQGVRFHRRRRIVQRVGVLRGFTLQLTLVGEGTSTTITEESIMPDELDIMARMTCLDAVHADRVPIGCVARVTPVEVVHRKRRVRADLIQTLPTGDGLLHLVLIIEDLVAPRYGLDATRQAQPAEFVVEDLVELQRGRGIVGNLNARRQPIEYPVALQYRMALRRYQHPGLSISENVVLL